MGGSRNPVADLGVDFGRDGGARNVGVFPGRDTRCAESGCFPGRDWSSAEDGCSPDEMNYCVLDDYCINSA